MNIVFKRVEINNFLSIGEASVELDNRGYVLISGINKCDLDNAQSNGAGKSSIHDAILWCLTGETSRGAKNVSNIFGDDGALVTCEFAIDDKEYIITRSKNHSIYKTDLKIKINGEDKSGKGIRDGEKLLGEYLPDLTVELLGNVVLLGQGMPYKFSSNTPSKRKELLEQLSKSDFMIEDIKNRVANRKSVIENEIRNKEILLSNIEKEISIYDAQILDFKAKIEEINKTLSIEDIENETKELAQLIKDKDRTKENISLIKQIQSKQEQLKIEAISGSESFDDREDIIKAKKELDEYRNKASSIAGNATQLKKQIAQFESVVDICPTCKQKLPGITKIDTSELHKQYDELLKEFWSARDEGIKINDWIKKEEDKFNKEYEEKLNFIESSISNCKNSIKDYELELENIEQKINNLNSIISLYEANRKSGKEQIELLTTKVNEFESKISNSIKQREKIVCEQDILDKRKSILTTMESLAKRDFRGYLLLDVIKYIETKAKEYCEDIFNTREVSFTLNGNDIDILYNNKEYELLSGGERQKIDIIIQLAIRDMLKNIMGFSSNIIVFDEIFDFLDAKGTNALIKSISTRLGDISTVFIISHHIDIDIPCDDTITVIKENNGISHIC